MKQKNNTLHIVLDPGHGGCEYGAVSHGFKEKDLNLIVAQSCYKKLIKYINVEITRDTDIFVPLTQRTKYKADYLISLHFNQLTENDNISGTEVWINKDQDDKLAELFLKNICRKFKLKNRGVKKTNDFVILRDSKCPALIIEHCFMSNAKIDLEIYSNKNKLKQLGELNAQVILEYFQIGPLPDD